MKYFNSVVKPLKTVVFLCCQTYIYVINMLKQSYLSCIIQLVWCMLLPSWFSHNLCAEFRVLNNLEL